ncbi:hypothetical protein NKH71_03595 [Mesorhizobium sp. M0983]|uniref:hypothetical protein n=1 Tax=Mesorhizobium sp. M0983 TaxID=2957040 RepID=UPI0033383157
MAVAPSLNCLSKESFLSLNSTPKSPYAIPLGDQGTDTTTTSGTTNPNSARDCAPGQQTGSAQQAAPGQQDTAANTAAPGQVKKTGEGC